jgi:hypothetical protein
VTGPSLTISTCVRAPKTPLSTRTPRAASAARKGLVQRLGLLRRRGVAEARPVSLRGVGDQGELADDERAAAGVENGFDRTCPPRPRRCAAVRPCRRGARRRRSYLRSRRRAGCTGRRRSSRQFCRRPRSVLGGRAGRQRACSLRDVADTGQGVACDADLEAVAASPPRPSNDRSQEHLTPGLRCQSGPARRLRCRPGGRGGFAAAAV